MGGIEAFPESMWDSGQGWEKTDKKQSCVTYVTEEHLMFVNWTLTYLTMDIVRWGGDKLRACGEG